MTTKTTTKHTPGPWYYDVYTPDKLIIGKRGQCSIAITTGRATNEALEEQEANTRLIVAAPELLEALKGLASQIQLNKLNVKKDFSLMNAHACALKAIHKAEGRA